MILTSERANLVLMAAQQGGYCMADRIEAQLTADEREHVKRVWAGMSGRASWFDAFNRIRQRGY